MQIVIRQLQPGCCVEKGSLQLRVVYLGLEYDVLVPVHGQRSLDNNTRRKRCRLQMLRPDSGQVAQPGVKKKRL